MNGQECTAADAEHRELLVVLSRSSTPIGRALQEVAADIQQSLDDVANGRVKPVDQAFDDVRYRLR